MSISSYSLHKLLAELGRIYVTYFVHCIENVRRTENLLYIILTNLTSSISLWRESITRDSKHWYIWKLGCWNLFSMCAINMSNKIILLEWPLGVDWCSADALPKNGLFFSLEDRCQYCRFQCLNCLNVHQLQLTNYWRVKTTILQEEYQRNDSMFSFGFSNRCAFQPMCFPTDVLSNQCVFQPMCFLMSVLSPPVFCILCLHCLKHMTCAVQSIRVVLNFTKPG